MNFNSILREVNDNNLKINEDSGNYELYYNSFMSDCPY